VSKFSSDGVAGPGTGKFRGEGENRRPKTQIPPKSLQTWGYLSGTVASRLFGERILFSFRRSSSKSGS